nr:hypothetical protein [Tanacetum cinerariifolium]
MMVQAQEEIGEGRQKDTKLPQTSVPTSVADEAVNEEMDDSLERAATTATSLDAEQDRGNIFKTQSKATHNEPGSQGTSSGGGLRCQETMRDVVAQTRVKKLEKKQRSRTYKLKRLYKVGLSARVESSNDEGLGEEDASKQRRISDIDADDDITLVSTRDEQMFDANQDLGGEDVFVAQQDENVVEKEVNVAQVQVTTAAITPTISIDEASLAQALAELKHAKPKTKAKGIVFHEPEESTTTTTSIPKPKLQVKDKVKRAEEKRNRPPTKAQQRNIMCTYLKNMDGWKLKSLKKKSFAEIQELFDKAMKKRAGDELEQERSKKQKVEDDKESGELKKCLEIILDDGDKVTVDATPLSSNKMLKIFDREDLEVLWRLVKDRFEKVMPVNHMDSFLLYNLKTMFEHHVEDNVWKNQQGLVKMYPLTNHTLHQMFNVVKLQVDYECEMAYELLKLVKKQLKEGYVSQ